MRKTSRLRVQLDGQGNLVLPPDILAAYGIVPGAMLKLVQDDYGLSISRSTASLTRVYIEPTNACNLDCTICMRNVWDEPSGFMSSPTFERILEGLSQVDPAPGVFFGGYGEPLAHPDIIQMVRKARQDGFEVELITNGTLLDRKTAQELIDAGLNRLWVSIDGASPQGYADIRLGSALPEVTNNLMELAYLRWSQSSSLPRIGIAFVAMKGNIHELPAVVRLAKRMGADQVLVTNILPHTSELEQQALYRKSIYSGDWEPNPYSPLIAMPDMDALPEVMQALGKLFEEQGCLELHHQRIDRGRNACPFMERGSLSIRWDGMASPCLPLLHSHRSYLDGTERIVRSHTVGNILENSLIEIWRGDKYSGLRERLMEHDFSPCTICNSCEMAASNQEDCFGNTAPACGGCLWAQGFIQCP